MTQVDQSWGLFDHQFFNATGEDHFLESKANVLQLRESDFIKHLRNVHIAGGKLIWLVVLTILKNMSSSMGKIIPYIMENKSHV